MSLGGLWSSLGLRSRRAAVGGLAAAGAVALYAAGDMGTAAAAALLVVALLGALSVLARRRASPSAANELSVSTRVALGRDSGVAVVTWRGRELLVGYSATGVSLLAGAPGREAP